MALSKTWNLNDNAYFDASDVSVYNEDCMCMFTNTFDGKVNRDVAIFAKKNGRREGLLYNNRLFIGIWNKQEMHKLQYEVNRQYILNNVL